MPPPPPPLLLLLLLPLLLLQTPAFSLWVRQAATRTLMAQASPTSLVRGGAVAATA
jgi:hypothetical protein